MSNTGLLGSATYEVETLVGETTTTTATYRAPHIGQIDVSGLVHNRMEPGHVEQYLNAGRSWILGTMEGQFKLKFDLTGHGSSTAGAVSITPRETLMGRIIGNASAAVAGTTLTGGTANIPTTTASGTHLAGGLTFIGALGDGDGDGQAYAISTHTAQNLTLLTDLRGAPVNGAALSGGVMLYPYEISTSSAVTTTRWLLQTANLQYLCHGCAPIAYSITGTGPAGRPQIEVTFQVAWWEYRSSTFPNTTSSDTFQPSANAAGSLFVQDKGTTSNVAGAGCRTFHDFQVDVTVGMEILRGPGGYNQYQDIVGYRRTPTKVKLTWTEAADAATTTPVLPEWTSAKHVLWSNCPADGKRIAAYFPNVCPAENKPVQFVDQNLNRLRFTGYAYTNDVTTNDLTLSCMRWLFA
jgi:hypothetical protein